MASDIVYSQRECAKCVELVLNGIERYKNNPRYADVKDEESLINWLMNDIINAIPFLIGLKDNYLKIYGHKHMPPKIRKIAREFVNDEISIQDAQSKLEKIMEMYETGVLLLDYRWDHITDRYVKVNVNELNQNSRRIIKKSKK